jgi:PAS domain S-box-containing protein
MDTVAKGFHESSLLRTLYDQSFELIGLLSPEGIVLDANRAALSLIDSRLSDVTGRFFWDTAWWDESEKPRLREAVQLAARGEFVRFKTQHADIDGKVRVIDFSLKPFRDDSGRVVYLIPEGRDITELEELEQERSRLAAIVESSGDAILSIGLSGIILSWNRGAERLYGYTSSEAIGQSIYILVPFEGIGELKDAIANCSAGNNIVLADAVSSRKDDSQLHVALTISPIFDSQGKTVSISLVARDITESTAAAKALKRGHQMLEAISKAQLEFIAGMDARTLFEGMLGNLLELTQSQYGFIGEVFHDESGAPYLKAHAITNISWNEETRNFYDANVEKGFEFHNLKTLFGAVMVTAKPVIANDPATDPRRGGLPKGHPPLKAFLGLPFFAGKEMIGMVGLANRPGGYSHELVNSLELVMGTCANIIKAYRIDLMRQFAERSLKVSETRLRGILDSAVDGIVTINESGVIQSFNPAAEAIFGYSASEMLGSKVNKLMPEPFRSDHDSYMRNYLETGIPKVIGVGREVVGLRKDGSIFPLELSVSEVLLEEGRLFTGIIRDITERRKMERLKREFISTVSHELRTPLTSIHGALGLLLGGVVGELPEKAGTLLSIARNNTARLMKLINDILDLEKLESERMSFRIESVNMRDVAVSSLEDNQTLAQERAIELIFNVQGESHFVLGDRDRLVQVATNLLSNALKFSPDNGRIDVSLSSAGGSVTMSVADHGPGVPEDFKDMIFEKFAQADSSDTRRKGGTGLGLSISKGIVERLGGSIGFASPPGGGAVFHFSLPALGKHNTRALEDKRLRGIMPRKEQKMASILHVDDDQDITDVVSLILKEIGQTTKAASLAEARALLGRQKFDLVVLDVILPDGSGLDLLPEIGVTPVLVFSVRELPVETAGKAGAVLLKSRTGNDRLLAEARRLLDLEGAN